MSYINKFLSGGLLLSFGSTAMAGVNSSIMIPQSIPAVSQVGLIALAFGLGIIGAKLIKKIQKSKR